MCSSSIFSFIVLGREYGTIDSSDKKNSKTNRERIIVEHDGANTCCCANHAFPFGNIDLPSRAAFTWIAQRTLTNGNTSHTHKPRYVIQSAPYTVQPLPGTREVDKLLLFLPPFVELFLPVNPMHTSSVHGAY